MRVFIAIDIEQQIKHALTDLQKKLQAEVSLDRRSVKWVDPAAMHLTLKFLGEIKDVEVVEVCGITEQVAARHRCFEMQIETVGTFGGRSPRIVWVGTKSDGDELLQLQKDLETALAKVGFPEEKRQFTGHLTLCRIKAPKAGVELARAIKVCSSLKLGATLVETVTVFQSQLTSQGPVYTVLGNYKLQ